MASLQQRHGIALLHVTDALALLDRTCGRILVMDAGRLVERGPTRDVLERPGHPATIALVNASTRLYARCAPSSLM